MTVIAFLRWEFDKHELALIQTVGESHTVFAQSKISVACTLFMACSPHSYKLLVTLIFMSAQSQGPNLR